MSSLVSSVPDAADEAAVHLQTPEFIDSIRSLPAFDRHARDAVALWRIEGDEEALSTSLRDMGRFIGAVWAIYLHNTPGGLTLTRLTGMLEGTDLSGPTRARAMIAYMQFLGYIARAPSRGDTRVKRYGPTERLLAGLGGRYRRELQAAAWLSPDIQWVLQRFGEPAVRDALIASQGDLLVSFFRNWRPDGPSLNVFSEKFGGMAVLAELLDCAEPGDSFPPKGALRYSTAALARACGANRTQVRRILRQAAQAGFLVLGGEGEAWPTPMLREHIELAAAGQMGSFIHSCRAVRRRFDTAG